MNYMAKWDSECAGQVASLKIYCQCKIIFKMLFARSNIMYKSQELEEVIVVFIFDALEINHSDGKNRI